MEIPDEKTILEAIQPFLREQEKERDIQDEIEFHGHRTQRISFLRDALTEFINQDLEDIVKVEPVWKWLQHRLREEVEDILFDKEYFVKQWEWEMGTAVEDALSDLGNSLDILLQKQHREMWRKETLQTAIQILKSWNDKGIFVAVLDKEGKLLAEPYPVTTDATAKVKVVIEDDTITKGRKNLVVKADKPIFGKNCKAMVLCKVPEEYTKAEIINMEG